MNDIIVIVGPTGVGKTHLSVELAKLIDAEIINGDSVAIYKDLDIGSAKPSEEEREGIIHHLIDIRNVTDNYSVYEYQKDVREKINEINSRGKRIIIVGGTGLYIKAALYDYKFSEGTTYKTYDNLSNLELVQEIEKHNVLKVPEVNNRKRLVRLLNKLENNEELTNNKDKPLYKVKVIGLTTKRDILYDRINKRVDLMLNNGLLEEIEKLKSKYKDSRILNTAIGYKEFSDFLFKDKSLDLVIEEVKRNSRRFAKRQYTFFNNQFNTEWFDVNFNDFNKTIDEVYKYIEKET